MMNKLKISLSKTLPRLKKITLKKVVQKFITREPLIDPWWYIKVKTLQSTSRKIKVGFGPITTPETDLAERKWRIDPIIDAINSMNCSYSAGFFVTPKEMEKFDLIVIIKKFNPSYIPFISKLKLKKKRFIFDIVDNPQCEEKHRYYFADHFDFFDLMDGFIISSPLQEETIRGLSSDVKTVLIEHPIIHHKYKREYQNDETIKVLAHGAYANLIITRQIEPILKEISDEIGKKLVLTYHSEVVYPDTEWVKYIRWTRENCFDEMVKFDIAVTIKDLNDLYQKAKPSTKVLSFMAAGLPVVCTPTLADRLVIEDGVTGLFAFSHAEWKLKLKALALDPIKQKLIGRSARQSVIDTYSIKEMTKKYVQFFEMVRE